MSVNLHAAAGAARWWGTDFLPAHAAFAQELAQAAGGRASLSDESFAAFCDRPDLPRFDVIALHGIWSWVSEASRQTLLNFVARRLRPGGVLYLGYNTRAGWATLAPIRDLMATHALRLTPPARDALASVEPALDFVQQVLAAEPALLRQVPQLADRVARLREQNRAYLAHEYFNQQWHLTSFTDLHSQLAPLGLVYAGSARPLEHVDALQLTPAQAALLRTVDDPVLREAARDVLTAQVYRADLWIKGGRRLTPGEQARVLQAQRVALIRPAAAVRLSARGAVGEVPLQEAVCRPLLEALADHRPHAVAELDSTLRARGGPSGAALHKLLLMLAGKGDLACVQPDEVIASSAPSAQALNRHLLRRSRDRLDLPLLASSVTGGAVPLDRYALLFLDALTAGQRQPPEWARHAQAIVAAGTAGGAPGAPAGPTPPALTLPEIQQQAQGFAERGLPLVQALQLV